jgi:excisionase family DNA binding protein
MNLTPIGGWTMQHQMSDSISLVSRGGPQVAGKELSIKALCEELSISDSTARKWMRSGYLPAPRRLGRQYRFDALAIARWREAGYTHPGQPSA